MQSSTVIKQSSESFEEEEQGLKEPEGTGIPLEHNPQIQLPGTLGGLQRSGSLRALTYVIYVYVMAE